MPNGSFSRIEQLSPPSAKTTHELYGSSDLNIGRLLHNRRFDWAMVAFLECLRGVMEWVRAQDASVDFPHQCVLRFPLRAREGLADWLWTGS